MKKMTYIPNWDWSVVQNDEMYTSEDTIHIDQFVHKLFGYGLDEYTERWEGYHALLKELTQVADEPVMRYSGGLQVDGGGRPGRRSLPWSCGHPNNGGYALIPT